MIRTSLGILALLSSLIGTTPAQAQQCTVPHTLTNGQVSDATEVMDNFSAVAACVDETDAEAVTHEGTPNAGEIAVFDSTTGITGGDLTGDVTTSGSTVATLADSGVVPGNYANPSIIVDSKGRITSATTGSGGGGGGSSYEASPVDIPALANFTWLNQGSATATDSSSGLVVTGDIDGEVHGLMQPAPSSTTFDVYMRVDQVTGSTGASGSFYSYPTIILRNSQSGRLLHAYLGRGRSSRDNFWTIGIQRWSSATSYASDGVGVKYLVGSMKWMRVSVAGDVVTLYVSPNGYNWIDMGTESLAAYVNAPGGTVDEIGLGLRADSVSFSTAVFQQFGTNAP